MYQRLFTRIWDALAATDPEALAMFSAWFDAHKTKCDECIRTDRADNGLDA